MRVVITVEEFDPDKGYLEYYLATELTKLGHKVFVMTFGWSNRIMRTVLEEKFEVINIPYVVSVSKYHIPTLGAVRYISQFIREEKPDMIHCQPLFSPLSLLFFTLRQSMSYKIVGSVVTGEVSTDTFVKKLMYFSVNFIMAKFLKSRSELIFVKSPELLKTLSLLIDIRNTKARIIPLGADPDLFKFDAEARENIREKLKVGRNDIMVVYSGKIIPSKNLHLLINALEPIMVRYPNTKALIVGSGPPPFVRSLTDHIAKLGISKNIIFHGWEHRRHLPGFYSASDIGVWPGGPSISIVEAASTGLPVVIQASPVEIYSIEYRNGFTFSQGSVDDLRKCLNTLITDARLREDMGHRSRLLVEEKLNWRKITLQYLEAYEEALN